MPIIKQGTTVIMVGPFLKSSNGYTRSNTQALSTSKVKLSKNDAALANKACTKASCVSTHGMYRIFLTTADSGTLGRLFVSVAATACLPVWKEYNVVAAKQWNSIFVDSDKLEVDVVQYNGGNTTAITTGKLDAAIVAKGSTFSSGQLTAALEAFVGTTDWDDAIGGLSTLSTADLDTAIDAAGLSTLSTGDLDDALTAYAPTTEAVSDITAAIFVTPANKLRTDTQGNVLLTTAARAEPGQGAPAVNADAMKKLDYLFKSWRNKKTQDATTWSLYNDAGAVVDQKATISDDGTTATIGEIGSGA
jgi:hypothetical protein